MRKSKQLPQTTVTPSLPTSSKTITESDWHALLERVGRGYSFAGSCRHLGIPYSTTYNWIRNDPELGELLEQAKELGKATLEDAALERAVEGVEEDVFQQGKRVGKKRVYSDNLLKLLLESRIPDTYGTKMNVSSTSIVRTMTDDQLNASVQNALERIKELDGEIEEGEFSEVTSIEGGGEREMERVEREGEGE